MFQKLFGNVKDMTVVELDVAGGHLLESLLGTDRRWVGLTWSGPCDQKVATMKKMINQDRVPEIFGQTICLDCSLDVSCFSLEPKCSNMALITHET